MTRSSLILDHRYRLDERIAAGGVGRVWRARDLLLERPVAVKLLRPEYADHPETLERFRTEARHAGALSHPGIAQVYDYGHAGPGGPPYLVMEFVDGPSLAGLLEAGPVEPGFALDVIAQAAGGLHAAHRIGLVHRDIKPANILICPEGRVKITDFGIAHAAGQAPVTAPGLVMGTANYMAPERIAGGAGTPASDLYALGIVLHECLTGLPPYEGSAAEVMAGHLYLPIPPLPAGAPPELDELVARLTAKDPASRLGDANQLAALAARLRDEITAGRLVPPASPGEQPRHRKSQPLALSAPPRRHRAAVLSGAAALVVAAALTGVFASGALGGTATTGHSHAASPPTLGATPSRAAHSKPTPARPGVTSSPSASAAKAANRGHGHKSTSASATSASTAPVAATPSETPAAPAAPSPVSSSPAQAPSTSSSNCLLGVICL